MITEIEEFEPDIILCPFLKKFVPKEIYTKYPTFVLHPGTIGDKGAYAIDNAIKEQKKRWGVVILKANEEYDSGDIWANVEFDMPSNIIQTRKSSIYRNQTKDASIKALKILFQNIDNPNFIPTKQLDTPPHKQLTQDDRKIDWDNDSTLDIINKINFSDSFPGVLDEILGVKCYLFGAWEEEKLSRSKPKQILAKRDGAICISSVDGAIWITHLKEPHRFKLPSTYVLKDRLKGIKEDRLPLIFDRSYKTFYEISCDIKDDIAYLYFNFHNGAFRAEQCIRLKYAIEYLKESVKVIVLAGGEEFFSNGINLNILEDSKKSGEDGWSTINAINDLIGTIIFASDIITVASLSKNAGAGGVFLATACDYVVAHSNTTLNPHYKTIGLSGSEYHTWTLPKRVGKENASKLLNECLPINAKYAKKIGLVNEVFYEDYQQNLENFVKNLINNQDWYDDFIWDKEDFLEANKDIINKYKEEEIKIMHSEFWLEDSPFHKLRYEFVHKICPIQTPKRLKHKGI
jgi:putative two-component system hydrogenase maturation factor HypX/HoxX